MADTAELIERQLHAFLAQVPEASRRGLIDAVQQIAREHTRQERERCVAFCTHRAELWGQTGVSPVLLAEEARARANEATYLADYLATDENTASAHADVVDDNVADDDHVGEVEVESDAETYPH